VVLDRYLQADFILPLLVDNQQGAKDAFYHLYDQGARHIYYVSGALDSFDNMERTNSFLHEADKNNISIQCFDGNFTEESGYAIAKMIIDTNHLPDAVFCANDQMAVGFIKAMGENNLKAPADIAIVGFDDIQISRYMQPTLTTIGTSRLAWGSLAATQLIDFLDYESPFQPVRIPTHLIQRESSTMYHHIPTVK
jgi:LacI family transcriptional regulator